MLKSTYKPPVSTSFATLPEGWTEHKAPTGKHYIAHGEASFCLPYLVSLCTDQDLIRTPILLPFVDEDIDIHPASDATATSTVYTT